MQYKVVPHYLFTELCTAKSLTSVKSRKLLQVWRKELYLSFKLPNWKETRIRKCQITRWISHHYKFEKIQGQIRFLTKEGYCIHFTAQRCQTLVDTLTSFRSNLFANFSEKCPALLRKQSHPSSSLDIFKVFFFFKNASKILELKMLSSSSFI